jgi:MFS family permease
VRESHHGAAGHPALQPARFGALRHRNFALFWVGLLVSHTGTWMQAVGQGWLVYQLTNTPVWLGITSLAFAVPMVVLPLVGGAVADRIDRINLIRSLQLLTAEAAFSLAAARTPGRSAPGIWPRSAWCRASCWPSRTRRATPGPRRPSWVR